MRMFGIETMPRTALPRSGLPRPAGVGRSGSQRDVLTFRDHLHHCSRRTVCWEPGVCGRADAGQATGHVYGLARISTLGRQPYSVRDFFLKYQDRIVFGTDSGASATIGGELHIDMEVGLNRIWMVRNYLETGDVFPVPFDPLMTPDDRPAIRGMALPQEVLRKIYAGNFQRVAGAAPKALDIDLVRQEMERIAALVDGSGAPVNPARQVVGLLAV
jgi:hypothetical protein